MMHQRKFEISLIFIIVCTLEISAGGGPDLTWLDRCRDTTQCPYGAGVYRDIFLICDGGVISKHHVLTVASCFSHIGSPKREIIRVRVGAVNDNSGKFYDVKNIKIHELYKKGNEIDANYDIAVLKISNKEGFDYDINITLLPYEELGINKFEAETFGWAHMRGRKEKDYFTHHPVDVYDRQTCYSFGMKVGPNQICGVVLNKEGNYVNYALHGGPLIYRKTLIGISLERAKGVGAQFYLNIYNHVTWISRAMY